MPMAAMVFGSRLGAVTFLILVLGAIPGASSPIEIPEKPRPDEPPRGAVLTGEAAVAIAMHSCHSFDPGSMNLWEPGPADITRLEKVLPEFMAGQQTPPDYQPLHEYYRQYVGVVRDGKKTICVNFFHYRFVRESLERHSHLDPVKKTVEEGHRAEDFWKREPINMCDGGADYFTIQFDLETGTFSQLGFNGYA